MERKKGQTTPTATQKHHHHRMHFDSCMEFNIDICCSSFCFRKIKCSFSMHHSLYSLTKHSKLSKYAHTHTHTHVHTQPHSTKKRKNKHASTENEKDDEEEIAPYMQICVSRRSVCTLNRFHIISVHWEIPNCREHAVCVHSWVSHCVCVYTYDGISMCRVCVCVHVCMGEWVCVNAFAACSL